ncbi:hypothetical protein BDR26DRAFT_1007062 [Obelidium mucronatum]|nr:hypothetical protein BDR26DRAFT_1007062 [Obelidium mucronatum]
MGINQKTPVIAKLNDIEEDNMSADMPVTLRFKIAMSMVVPVASLVVICSLLSSYINESSPSKGEHTLLPPLLVNGSGSSMMANTYWRSLASFSAYLQQQQSPYVLDSSFLAAGSGVGRSDFFNAFGLFGATDSDVSASDLKYFLPDDGSGYSNVTKYIDPRAPAHLGALLFPTMAGALAVIHNVPGLPDWKVQLILNGTVLGDMFCGAIAWWNATAIQELNPGLPLPAAQIKLIGRGDSSGSTQIFTSYLVKYSSKFKSLIGASSLPKWPSSTILGNSAGELIYISSNIKYSLTYAPMESVFQARSVGQSPQIAALYNAMQVLTIPNTESTVRAMKAAAEGAPFNHHNYLNIYDIRDAAAYPISLMSFILIRENYFYFSPGSQYECDRIKAMVYFWYFLFTNMQVKNENLAQGWVSVTGKLVDDNLYALNLVSCNRKNVMDDLNLGFKRKEFYANRSKAYDWDNSIKFWDNTSNISSTPVGYSLYMIYYIALILANAIPFGINFYQIQLNQTGLEESSDSRSMRLSTNMQGENGEDDDDDQKEELAMKTAGKVKFTIQNQLAIITQFVTCFQILYLCLHKSVVIQDNLYMDVISYLGLIPDWYAYYIILLVLVFVWLVCMLYTTYFYAILEEYYPRKLVGLTYFHSVLADFLPNYAVIMYSPSVELLSKVFDCRLSTQDWIFKNSFEEACFAGRHWTMSLLSLVLSCAFTNSVVRYSKTLKSLRKQFDFKDKEWCIYLDSVSKTLILILYFNIGNKEFLSTLIALLSLLALCSLLGKPNEIFWYNYFRGGIYIYCAVISKLSLAVLIITSALSLLVYFLFVGTFKLGLSGKEMKEKEEELKQFFAAFGNEDMSSTMVGMAQCTQQSTANQVDFLFTSANSMIPSSSVVSSSVGNLETWMFSASQWRKFETMTVKAKKIDLLTSEEYKFVKAALKCEDPIIPLLFARSGKSLPRFIDLLKLKVYQVFAKDSTSFANWSRNTNQNIVVSEVPKFGMNHSLGDHGHPARLSASSQRGGGGGFVSISDESRNSQHSQQGKVSKT